MARVYLATTNDAARVGDWWTDFSRLKKSALMCASPVHALVETPDQADIILFSDSLSIDQADIRGHILTKQYSDKVFVYSALDHNIPFLPGIYTSAERQWYVPSRMRAGFYIKVIEHDWIQPSPIDDKARYLFSFCGAFDIHPLRRRIGNLACARGLIKDTSKDEGRGFGKSADTYQRWQLDYFKTICESKFVLCPRGAAPSSYRIFEAMKAGRVPVIISDAWVPPVGPNWAEFSLRFQENSIEDVPCLLKSISDKAPEMGLLARKAWEHWFSEERAFQTIVTWCLQIKKARGEQRWLDPYLPFIQLARPFYFRHLVLASAKKKFCR